MLIFADFPGMVGGEIVPTLRRYFSPGMAGKSKIERKKTGNLFVISCFGVPLVMGYRY